MTLVETGVAIFFTIFSLTALLTLASLPGWVKISENYKKALFAALILEVIGFVVGFVRATSMGDGVPVVSRDLLVANNWNWQYAQKKMFSEARFDSTADGIMFHAITKFYSGDEEFSIIEWESSGPIQIPFGSGRISFDVCRRWTKDAVHFDPDLTHEIGQEYCGPMTLETDLALRGSWTVRGGTETWGVFLARAWE